MELAVYLCVGVFLFNMVVLWVFCVCVARIVLHLSF